MRRIWWIVGLFAGSSCSIDAISCDVCGEKPYGMGAYFP
jgi:hypothetical protein